MQPEIPIPARTKAATIFVISLYFLKAAHARFRRSSPIVSYCCSLNEDNRLPRNKSRLLSTVPRWSCDLLVLGWLAHAINLPSFQLPSFHLFTVISHLPKQPLRWKGGLILSVFFIIQISFWTDWKATCIIPFQSRLTGKQWATRGCSRIHICFKKIFLYWCKLSKFSWLSVRKWNKGSMHERLVL